MKTALKILSFIIALAAAIPMAAQGFSVSSFKPLPNDISAFINPVKDLNDEDCALLKIIAPEEFAFSSPLGIVKRIDKVGEIWIYLPRKSKKMTFKHPRYGVLRDYKFPEKIESHLTYEIRLDLPSEYYNPTDLTLGKPVVERDTLILTKTDTIMLDAPKKHIPFSFTSAVFVEFGGNTNTVMGGLMVTAMRSHGGYVRIASDFGKSVNAPEVSDKDGFINGICPYYSGKTRNSAFQVSAGAIHRISSLLDVFEGIGYARNNHYWQKGESEGGGFVKNSHYCYSGVLIEAGVMVSFKKLALSASVSTMEGSQWFGSLGVGFKF